MKGFFACLLLLLCAWLVLLGCTRCHGADATLHWTPSPDLIAAGYAIYYGDAGGPVRGRMNTGNVLTATVSNLQAGQTYFFYVTAYDASGQETDPSRVIDYTVPVPSVFVAEGPDLTGPWYQKFSSPIYPTNQTFVIDLFGVDNPPGGAVAILSVDGREWWRETSADVRRFYKLTTNP